MADKIVMYDSPEAASIQTVTGWVSRTGLFCGKDEHMARYHGATHRQCDNPNHPPYELRGYCLACSDERSAARFGAMPKVEWDGKTPLALHDTDCYFFDEEELRDYLLDNDIALEDARLVICKPNMASEIEPDEHYSDDLPEDGEVGAELRAAFDALNEAIRREKPMSWSPGKTAAVLPADFLAVQAA